MAVLSIGGMALGLDGGDSLRRTLALPGMATFVSDVDPEVHVHLDVDLSLPPCRLLHRFDIADGNAECRFGIDNEGVYWYDFGEERLLCYDPRKPGEAMISPISDVSVLRFALWTAYSMLGLSRGRVPVHSSVVVCDGRAVMCLGESGTGKSTHTRLWLENIQGTHLLNDDSPILAVEEDMAVVYGSPWSGKTHCYRQECVPLTALVRLEQKPENTIRRLGVIESFAALQPSCPPCLVRDEWCTDRLVAFISDIIRRTAVYRMGCLPNADAARMSYIRIME